MKQLYFLHIPKTAGSFVSENIKNSINNDLLCYIGPIFSNNSESLKSKIYISFHAGTYPVELLEDISVATLIRDPISARASYFNFIYPRALHNKNEYKDLPSNRERFLYYLFEDKNFLVHNNYQSRFICNPSDGRSVARTDENTSIDNAIHNINSFEIVNTFDNIEVFCGKIKNWFMLNHNIEVNFDFNNKINVGPSKLNEESVSSGYFVNLLTQDEKDRVLELNNIDLQVYNFVKNKEATNV